MQENEIQQKLFKIVNVYLPQDVSSDAIQLHSHFLQDLGINSAHLVDIALDAEDAFDITLDEKDMEEMQTVTDVIKIVALKTAL